VFTFADCELDPDRYELRRGGDVVHVEPQVFAVLVLLVRHHDRVVRQAEMLDSVWGTRCVSVSTLTSRVKAARRAIGDDGTGQRMIRTVRGVGYRFVAPIHEHADPEATGSLPQDIRFCRGHDGVRIALARLGTGPVLVKAANWMTHLGFDVDSPFWRHWLAGLSTGRRLVRYDARGCGLSSRDVVRLGLDELVQDLELVVDSLALQRFPLIGLSQGGAVAITYAARHPDRVTSLVLVGACARGATALATAAAQRWPPLDELPRRTTSAATTLLFREALARVDVRRAAAHVACPTLVLHARGDQVVPLECAAELAATIPDSRLVPLAGSSHLPREDEAAWPVLLATLRAFLDREVDRDVARAGPLPASAPGLHPAAAGAVPAVRRWPAGRAQVQ
jgi:DNA-binding winged helix-turn-helix (wHTH) protein/pimeloyl-ACP methyl ester carboxylesterase